MKKQLALILSAIFILMLAACGEEPAVPTTEATQPTTQATQPLTDPTEPPATEPTEPKFQPDACRDLFGQWTHAVVLDRELMALPEFQGSTQFSVVWSFLDDGTYTMTTDAQQMEEAIAGYETLLIDYMVDSRYRMFVAECNRMGKYEAYIQKEWVENGLGQQERDAATETVAALNLRERLEGLNSSGLYYVEAGILYLEEAPCPFELKEGILTLTEGAPLSPLLPTPLVLTSITE